MTVTSIGHLAHCSVVAPRARSFRNYSTSRLPANHRKPCACRAQSSERSGTIVGLSLLPALLQQSAAFAEEVTEQAKQAVDQGKQLAEQAQQQFTLPSDLQYPSGAASKLPSNLPSSSAIEDYFSQNPGVIAAGVAVLATGLLLARLIGTGVTAKKVTAAKAFDILSRNPKTLFVDIRSKKEASETGTPDLRSVKNKVISLPYTTVSVLQHSGCPQTLQLLEMRFACCTIIDCHDHANKQSLAQLSVGNCHHMQGLAGDLVEGFPDKLLKLPGLSEDSEIVFFDS